MKILTQGGNLRDIDAEAVAGLASSLRGPLLQPGDSGYDTARCVFNGLIDRRPALIARCQGTADVVDVLRFCRAHDLQATVRGGGHNIGGHCIADDTVMIDLALMNCVRVDTERRTASVDGGALWAEVDRETQAFGLATPGGIVSHTGVAGLTLNGGIGWLRNKHGLSCDNLLGAELVTADARVLQVNAESHPELYWALRGGGGNFGVVTRFEFVLHRVGPEVATVFSFYPIDQAEAVLRGWRDWVPQAPAEISSEVAMLTTLPEGLPEELLDQEVVVAAGVHCGDPAQGLQALQPLRELGTPLGEIAGALPYRGVQTAFDASFPKTGEVQGYWKSHYLDALSDKAIRIMAERGQNRSSRWTMVFVQHLGEGVRRIPASETAFPMRTAPFVMDFQGNWREDGRREEHIAWVRQAWAQLEPEANGGIYLNYEGHEGDDTQLRMRDAFGANYARLVAVKSSYDPDNFFRHNQNIKPA